MIDKWFEIVSIDHFWVQRRFQVLQALAGDWVGHARNILEVGCGNGLVQRQIEDFYGREVTGCDLSEFALGRNISRRSPLLCYDILERKEDLHERFDLVLLFDVLEHVDDGPFLEAVKFHLAPGGRIVVNVPAGRRFERYDHTRDFRR